MDQVSKIMAFESGELDFDQTVELFQELIDFMEICYGLCITRIEV